MAKGTAAGTIVGTIFVIVVVWLFVFGGMGALQNLFGPGTSPPPSQDRFASTIQSINAGGTANVQITSGNTEASIGDTNANFGGVAIVTITLVVQNIAPTNATANHQFQVTVNPSDDPVYTPTSGSQYPLVLLAQQVPVCPEITYAFTGGSGFTTGSPCGFQGVVGTNAGMTLTLSLSMNVGLFGATPPTGTNLVLTIHTSNGNDLKITWQIAG